MEGIAGAVTPIFNLLLIKSNLGTQMIKYQQQKDLHNAQCLPHSGDGGYDEIDHFMELQACFPVRRVLGRRVVGVPQGLVVLHDMKHPLQHPNQTSN